MNTVRFSAGFIGIKFVNGIVIIETANAGITDMEMAIYAEHVVVFDERTKKTCLSPISMNIYNADVVVTGYVDQNNEYVAVINIKERE